MKSLLSLHYMVWLVLSALFFSAGELLSKKFALEPKLSWMLFALLAYTIAILLWFPAILQKNQLSIVGVLWSVLSLLATVLIGTLLFGERLNFVGLAGIAAAVLSIVLLAHA